MPLELAKGVRDFPPEEKMLRQDAVDRMRVIFERYGYAPLETPAFERLDVLSAKYAAGEDSDVMKETFTFEDQGKRRLGLRFDLTVPFARYIAMHPELKMPFKRYQIEKVWRDGPIKLGRYREFWQCDVDIAGSASMVADAEFVDIVAQVFESLGLSVILEINNRKFLEGMLTQVGIPKAKHTPAMIVVDKWKKLTKKELENEFAERGIDDEAAIKLLSLIQMSGTNAEILKLMDDLSATDIGKEGVRELKEIMQHAKALGITNVRINPGLCRGLSYYTGPVFEGFLADAEEMGISSSVCGGGRYDDMIGHYVGQGKSVPAVGISFGLEPITEALKKKRPLERKTPTKTYIVPVGKTEEAILICKEIRMAGIPADMDIDGKGISKNLSYANVQGIPFAIIVGEDELRQKKVKLRDMRSGKEEVLSLKDVIHILKTKYSG